MGPLRAASLLRPTTVPELRAAISHARNQRVPCRRPDLTTDGQNGYRDFPKISPILKFSWWPFLNRFLITIISVYFILMPIASLYDVWFGRNKISNFSKSPEFESSWPPPEVWSTNVCALLVFLICHKPYITTEGHLSWKLKVWDLIYKLHRFCLLPPEKYFDLFLLFILEQLPIAISHCQQFESGKYLCWWFLPGIKAKNLKEKIKK